MKKYCGLVDENNSYMTPIHKIHKRFLNGPEDSVTFYDVMCHFIYAIKDPTCRLGLFLCIILVIIFIH